MLRVVCPLIIFSFDYMKKRTFYILATLLLLASCYPTDSYLHFVVKITDNIKAVISINTSPHRRCWSGNEEITILSQAKEGCTGLYEDVYAESSYALYPADNNATFIDGKIATVLPEYRDYNAIAEPIMVAQHGNFEEASVMLCINLSSESDMGQMLKSITLSSALQSIAGRVEIDCTRDLAMNFVEGGSNSITMTNIDAMLSAEERRLYIAMPPVAFADDELCLSFEFESDSYTIALPQLTLERGIMHTVHCRF